MFDFKNELGVPRWTEPEMYLEAEEKSDPQWRWEFLRRRPDYREAWKINYDDCQHRFDKMHEQGLLDSRERYRGIGSSIRAICEPFFVRVVIAPWETITPVGFWDLPFGWMYGGVSINTPIGSLVDEAEHRDRQGQLLIAFDLNRSFEVQIAKARASFEAVQMERHGQILTKNRHHKRKWATYLRAIDARDQGATYENLYTELELSHLSVAEYDAALDKNLAASGLQLWRQAHDLMFKVTS